MSPASEGAFDLRRVDVHDDEQFTVWFGVLQRSEFVRDQGRHGGWLPQEWRARALDEEAAVYHQLFSFGSTPLDPVAVGALELTREDNLEWCDANLFVDPPERRKGSAPRRSRDSRRALANSDGRRS